MGSSRRAVLRALLLALASALLIACGENSPPTEEEKIVALVERLQSDLRRDRVEAVCAAMTKRPARQVGSVGHHTRPRNCPDDLYKLVMSSRARDGVPVKGLGQTPPPKVASVEVDASRAKATATLTFGHQPFDVPFVKRNGRWALDDFFGAIGPIRVDLR